MTEEYKIRYSTEVSEVIDDMASEEGIEITELLRRALNFYEIRLDMQRNHKEMYLQCVSGFVEHVIIS